jgi:hypothetical protein
VTGDDQNLCMTMESDLWWRLFKAGGTMQFVDEFIDVKREHADTKIKIKLRHYQVFMKVVLMHYGRVPMKRWRDQPYAIWFKMFSEWSS